MRYLLLFLFLINFVYPQNWQVKRYVDDFGDYIDKKYAFNSSAGKFSNSATTNSLLGVRFIVEYNSVEFQLYEYGRNHPVKAYSTTQYSIYVKDNLGEKHFFTGSIYEGGNRIGVLKDSELINIFKKASYADFFVKEKSNGVQSTYKFRIKLNGFTRTYNTVAKEKELAEIQKNIIKEQEQKEKIQKLKTDIQQIEIEIKIQKEGLNFPYKTVAKSKPQIYDGYDLTTKNILGYIKEGTEIEILDFVDGHFKINKPEDSNLILLLKNDAIIRVPDIIYFPDTFIAELDDSGDFEKKTAIIKELQNTLYTKRAELGE